MRLSTLFATLVGLVSLSAAPAPRGLTIDLIAVEAAPFVDANGVGWDGLSGTGPDFFVTIQVGGQDRWRSAAYRDVSPGSLPLPWDVQPGFAISEGQSVRIVLWDQDPGGVEFVAQSADISTRALGNYMGVPQRLQGTRGSVFQVQVGSRY